MNAIEVIYALNWIWKRTDYLVLLLRIKPLEATSTYGRILPNKAKLGLCHIVRLTDYILLSSIWVLWFEYKLCCFLLTTGCPGRLTRTPTNLKSSLTALETNLRALKRNSAVFFTYMSCTKISYRSIISDRRLIRSYCANYHHLVVCQVKFQQALGE